MNVEIREVLERVVAEVLERLAFMFAEPADREALTRAIPDALAASIQFSGERDGSMVLAVTNAQCAELAANVLGVEPQDDMVTQHRDDALAELLNVTCGHMLTEIAGTEPVFDMSVPVITALDGTAWDALLDAPDTACFLVDGKPVLAQFMMHQHRP